MCLGKCLDLCFATAIFTSSERAVLRQIVAGAVLASKLAGDKTNASAKESHGAPYFAPIRCPAQVSSLPAWPSARRGGAFRAGWQLARALLRRWPQGNVCCTFTHRQQLKHLVQDRR